jgi:hypothetical protein
LPVHPLLTWLYLKLPSKPSGRQALLIAPPQDGLTPACPTPKWLCHTQKSNIRRAMLAGDRYSLGEALDLAFHRVAGSLTSRRVVLCCAAIWLAALLTFEYYTRIEAPKLEKRMAAHAAIVTGAAPYQLRYRVLIPHAAEVLARFIQQSPLGRLRPAAGSRPYGTQAFAAAYVLLNYAALLVLLLCMGELLCRLFSLRLALLGLAMTALLVDFTFRDHYFHPWSLWEGAFFALGLLLIHTKSYKLLTGVLLLSLLNRETSVFLLLAFLLNAMPLSTRRTEWSEAFHRQDFRFAVANLIAWLAGFFALHRLVGYKPATFFVETAINGNSANLWYAVLLNVLFLGPLLPLAAKGVTCAPTLIRRAAMILPAYFGLLLVIGYWWEIRYWISVLPILVPAVIAGGEAVASSRGHRPESLHAASVRVEDDPAAFLLETERHLPQP